MFEDAVEKILADYCTPSVVRSIENGAPATRLWSTLSDADFLDLMAAQDTGDAAVTLDMLFPIFKLLGRYAVPVPIGQTIAARALLAGSSIAVREGMVTLSGCARREADGSVTAPMTAFGLLADIALVNLEGELLACDLPLARHVAVEGVYARRFTGERKSCPCRSPRAASMFVSSIQPFMRQLWQERWSGCSP